MLKAVLRLGVVLLSDVLTMAQTSTGVIDGTVLDPAAAVVPAARVVVTHVATGRALDLRTNQEGRYVAAGLAAGDYIVRVEAPGFDTLVVSGIPVRAGEVYNGTVTLTLGKVDTVLTVNAQEVSVDTVRHAVDTVITGREIRNFPLIGSRNALSLAVLSPGVLESSAAALDATKAGPAYVAVGIAGRLGAGTRILLDGIQITDPIGGGTLLNVSPEIVQQFQVTQSSLDPWTPTTSSGVVQITSFGGANDVHGSGFWHYNNQDMSARQNYERENQPFHRHQLGASVGGPVLRDRLFWRVGAEATRQQVNRTSRLIEFPQVNVAYGAPVETTNASGRVDWNATDSLRAFASLLHDGNITSAGSVTSPYVNGNWANGLLGGADYATSNRALSYRFGYLTYNNRIQPEERGFPFPRFDNGLPYALNVGAFSAGPSMAGPQRTTVSSLQNSAGMLLVKGRNDIRFGGSFERLVMALGMGPHAPLLVGQYNPASLMQVASRGGDPTDPLEHPLVFFNVGPSTAYPSLQPAHGQRYGGATDDRFNLYLSHSTRFRRLTLTSSLRWDYGTNYVPSSTDLPRLAIFDTWIQGASKPLRSPRDLFSPQIGFAFDPLGDGKTSIRGGFSLAREYPLRNAALSDQSGLLPSSLTGVVFDAAFIGLPNGEPLNIDGAHPTGNYADLLGRPIRSVLPILGRIQQRLLDAFAAYEPDASREVTLFQSSRGTAGTFLPGSQWKSPYSVQFNIGIQRQVFNRSVLSVDYIHNHGVGLPMLPVDHELRMDASILDVNAASARIGSVLQGQTVDQWLAGGPGRSIANFALMNDIVWPGRTPYYLNAKFLSGGFTRYRALNVQWRGSHSRVPFLRDFSYIVNYALSRSESSARTFNPEFSTDGRINNRDWNSREHFGPTALDATHRFSAFLLFSAPGGIRFTTTTFFRTAGASTLLLPALGAASGVNQAFGVDVTGDSQVDPLPGLGAGQWGRKAKNIGELNGILERYNRDVAGTLTPHGRALVNAGLFTADQMRRLGAVTPTIPLIPAGNPHPFHNAFVTNLRAQKVFDFSFGDKVVRFGPYLDVINLFNHAPRAPYSDLGGVFGSLNFDYAQAPAGRQVSDLAARYGRISSTRQMQVGARFDF